MTVWEKLEEDCYAVAIYNYAGSSPGLVPHLPLEVGELVAVERRCAAWYWGRSLRHPQRPAGAFPRSYVVIRECTVEKCGDEVLASAGSGVAHDIALTLREWLPLWKQLYTSNDPRFKFIEVSMLTLLELRPAGGGRGLGALPLDRLRRLASTARTALDKGDRTLGLELRVRDASGRPLDPDAMSLYQLNAAHDDVNDRLDKNMDTTPRLSQQGASSGSSASTGGAARCFSLCVTVHNFVSRCGEPCELMLALYDAAGAQCTEHLLLRWPPPHHSHSAHQHPPQVLYTDLNSDMKREKIFIACYVVRVGAMEPQSLDHRRISVSSTGAGAGAAAGAARVRRPAGVAAADITKYLAPTHDPDEHIAVPFYPYEKESLDALLRKVVTSREGGAKPGQALWLAVRPLEGDLHQIREHSPHAVVGGAAVARRMGFPDVILPDDARNDLYVTLGGAALARPRQPNIELTARLCDARGRLIPRAISPGAGQPLASEYTSMVYYHEERPRWAETFRVSLNIDQFKEAHLVVLARHRSSNEAKDRQEKPFALSYVRLMQHAGTTLRDGAHDLAVYKIEYKRSSTLSQEESEAAAAAACLALPERRADLPVGAERGLTRAPLALQPKDSLTLHTVLCSTKLTQREEILGVLKWSSRVMERSLRTALRDLLQVPSEELVKFLQDILDALFDVLTQVEEDEDPGMVGYSHVSYGVLVLDALLRVVALVADHKYQHFASVLHHYIDNAFCHALAYQKLIPVLVWVIECGSNSEVALKRLLQCMKCIECLVRLAARSMALHAALAPAPAAPRTELLRLFASLESLMRRGDAALTCQGSALKYLPAAVGPALTVTEAVSLSETIVTVLSALPLGRLGKQRVLALLELSRGPLAVGASAAAPRRTLLPHLARTVAALMDDNNERGAGWGAGAGAGQARGVHKAARLLGADSAALTDYTHQTHMMELCVETLGETVSLLGGGAGGAVGGGAAGSEREEVARYALPALLRAAGSLLLDPTRQEALLRRTVCVLLDMFGLLGAEGWARVAGGAAGAAGEGGVRELARPALALCRALLATPPPPPRAALHRAMHRATLHALRLIGESLVSELETYPSETLPLIVSWFLGAAGLCTAPALQLERLGGARRPPELQRYGALRADAARALTDMYYHLGEYISTIAESIAPAILEASCVKDDRVREALLPLLEDMLAQAAAAGGGGGGDGGDGGEEEESRLRRLEGVLVEEMDALAERGAGDAAWAAAARQRPAAATLAAAAEVLFRYRSAASAEQKLHLTTTVLSLYTQIQRPHMYIRYVHKLAEMHRARLDWVEAALTLRLHAALLRWEHLPLPPRLLPPPPSPSPQPPPALAAPSTTHRALKEELYIEMAELLQQGRLWEMAVDVIKELVEVYEKEAGHAALAELHARLSELYGAVGRGVRPPPAYYRVLYVGAAPDHLRSPHGFIYRGLDFEQLGDFTARLLDEWPSAQRLQSLDEPSEEMINDTDVMYIQAVAVEPAPAHSPQHHHAALNVFTYSRPFFRTEEEEEIENESTNSIITNGDCDPSEGSGADGDAASLAGDGGEGLSMDDAGDEDTDELARRWLQRTELTTAEPLPGILRWAAVTSVRRYWVSPLESAVETMRRSNAELLGAARAALAPQASLHPLTMKLNGILDAAVQGGVARYERAFLTPRYAAARPQHAPQAADLKDLIRQQVPVLDYALSVHGSRVPGELEALHAHLAARLAHLRAHVLARYGGGAPPPTLALPHAHSTHTEPEVTLRRVLERRAPQERLSDASAAGETAAAAAAAARANKFFSFNSTQFNPLARYSGSNNNYFSTLQASPKRRDKRRARKSEVGGSGGSQWYTSPSAPAPAASPATPATTPGGSVDSSPLRELRQDLVPARPPRAGAERRLSQRASLLPGNRDSIGTTDSNQEEEEPPPLPVKGRERPRRPQPTDDNNNPHATAAPTAPAAPAETPAVPSETAPRYSYDTVCSPRGSFLYTSLASRRGRAGAGAGARAGGEGERAPTPPPKRKQQPSHA